MKVQVRQAKHKTKFNKVSHPNKRGPLNWNVREDCFGFTRVWVYKNHRHAMANAWRIANLRRISFVGLRGFHIEYEAGQ